MNTEVSGGSQAFIKKLLGLWKMSLEVKSNSIEIVTMVAQKQPLNTRSVEAGM